MHSPTRPSTRGPARFLAMLLAVISVAGIAAVSGASPAAAGRFCESVKSVRATFDQAGQTVAPDATLRGTVRPGTGGSVLRVAVRYSRREARWNGTAYQFDRDGYYGADAALGPVAADGSRTWSFSRPGGFGFGTNQLGITPYQSGPGDPQGRSLVFPLAVGDVAAPTVSITSSATPAADDPLTGEGSYRFGVKQYRVRLIRTDLAEPAYWQGDRWGYGQKFFDAEKLNEVIEGDSEWRLALPGGLPSGSYDVEVEALQWSVAPVFATQTITVPGALDPADPTPAPNKGSTFQFTSIAHGDIIDFDTPIQGTGTNFEPEFPFQTHIDAQRDGTGAEWWTGTEFVNTHAGLGMTISNIVAVDDHYTFNWTLDRLLPTGQQLGADDDLILEIWGRDQLDAPAVTSRICVADVLDTAEAPTLTITSPAPGAVVTPTTDVTGSAADDGAIDRVTVQIKQAGVSRWWDGSAWQPNTVTLLAALTPTGPGTVDWAYTPTLPGGDLRITMQAFDNAGQGMFKGISIRADDAPSITINAPAGGDTVDADTDVTGTATDDLGVDRVKVQIKRQGANQWWDGAAWVGLPFSHDVPLVPSPEVTSVTWAFTDSLPEGRLRITANTVDTGGRNTFVGRNFSVVSEPVLT